MALKLSIGFQKKLGQPDYGSLGATCHVEFEVDQALFHNDLDGFHRKAQQAFTACQQAVNDQLARQAAGTARNGDGHPPANGTGPTNGNGNGKMGISGSAGSSGTGDTPRLATQSQARAIRAIASRQRVDLPNLLEARYGVPRPEGLRISDASSLIDELKGGNGDQGGAR
jgi:hypothetical protein